MICTVKNWKKYQHYKDRNPPWIKLHFALLSSEDWVMLEDASRVLAVACMLVASRNDGQIDCSPKGLAYLKRVAYLNSDPDPKPLIECGFLESASTTLADASNLHANARPETETETETEKIDRSSGDDRFPEFWKIYPRKVGKPKAQQAWKKIQPELLDKILAHLRERVGKDSQWLEGKQFIPHPTTWLNREGWDDEYETASSKAEFDDGVYH